VDHQSDFNVRSVRCRADGVEIALPELAIAAVAGILAAPDRTQLIALERRADLADVLGREAGERNRQIEAQGHVAPAMVLEAVNDFPHLGLVIYLPNNDPRGFQCRRINANAA